MNNLQIKNIKYSIINNKVILINGTELISFDKSDFFQGILTYGKLDNIYIDLNTIATL